MLKPKMLLTGVIVCFGTALLFTLIKDTAGAHATYTAGVVLSWLWIAVE